MKTTKTMKTKMWILLSAVILTIACGDSNPCQQCGFAPNEQVINEGTKGKKIYYADGNGCVKIASSDCGGVKLKTLNS